MQLVIKYLENERDNIVFESSDDDAASEWYGHLDYVINQLKNNKMTIKEASTSLRMNLSE